MIGGQSNKGTKYWFTTQTRFKMLPTICAFSCLDTRKVTKENQEIPKLAYGSNSGISKMAYA